MVNVDKLIEQLDAPHCEVCPAQATCEDVEEFGCLHHDAAAALRIQKSQIAELERKLAAGNGTAFRLGQLDMRERCAALIRECVDIAKGRAQCLLKMSADTIVNLEVHDV